MRNAIHALNTEFHYIQDSRNVTFLLPICLPYRQNYTCVSDIIFVITCFSPAGLEGSSIIGKNKTFLSVLGNWLKPVVQSSSSSWKRCWRATVDGDAAFTFHSQCDAKGPTVTIIKVGQYIFGGYTSTSWNSK